MIDQLIDLVLSTLPYPEEEFDRENPLWPPWRRTPWVGTRHRMDALYGRDFNVNNLPAKVLDYIDDQFGPLSIDTVSQAIHFARFRTITNTRGFNDYVTPESLRAKFRFPILHVHGREERADFRADAESTLARRCGTATRASKARRVSARNGTTSGHQDLLIGSPAAAMFNDVNAFFEKPDREQPWNRRKNRITFASHVPAFGVRLNPGFTPGNERHSLGDHGRRGAPIAVLLVPVALHEGRYRPVGGNLSKDVAWRAVQPVSPGRERTRFTFDLAGYTPPATASGVLVLLMYNLSAEFAPASPGSHGMLAR